SPEPPNRALMPERKWRVRLGAAAEVDFANILKWTTENFGARQSRVYRDTLVRAIGELAEGPDVAGSKGPGRDHGRPSHAPCCAARPSRKPFRDVPGRAEQHDRSRAHPPRQNGPSAPRPICPRRE